MDLEKLEIHIRNWLIIGFFLVIDILLIILFVDNVFLTHLKVLKAGGWDALAFLGAIIGGAITFYGVRYTIKEQYKKEFIDKYPEKFLNGEIVREYCASIVRFAFNEVLNGNNQGDYTEKINTFKEASGEMIIKSSKISGKAYLLTCDFLHNFNTFVFFVNQGWPTAPNNPENELEKFEGKMDKLLEQLDDELDSIEHSYRKLIMDGK